MPDTSLRQMTDRQNFIYSSQHEESTIITTLQMKNEAER